MVSWNFPLILSLAFRVYYDSSDKKLKIYFLLLETTFPNLLFRKFLKKNESEIIGRTLTKTTTLFKQM